MSNWPFISVVVPVYNEADDIEELILSLLALDYPADRHEIIIIDNGSTDNTLQIIKKYPVTLLEEREKRGASAARNKGIRQAKGEIIAFIDADCVATSDWLKKLVVDHDDLTIGAFAGEVKGCEPVYTKVQAVYNFHRNLSPFIYQNLPNGERQAVLKKRPPIYPLTALERLWARLGLTNYHQKHSFPPMHTAPTANVAYRKAVFEEIGLFDLSLLRGQDPDLAYRMQLHSNYRFHPAPEAIVYHKHETTFAQVFSHQQLYGLGWVLHIDKYVGLNSTVRRQVLLESCLNIIFGIPNFMVMLGVRGIRSVMREQPYSVYLYEPLVFWVKDLAHNYGRIKACLSGISAQKQSTLDDNQKTAPRLKNKKNLNVVQ